MGKSSRSFNKPCGEGLCQFSNLIHPAWMLGEIEQAKGNRPVEQGAVDGVRGRWRSRMLGPGHAWRAVGAEKEVKKTER